MNAEFATDFVNKSTALVCRVYDSLYRESGLRLWDLQEFERCQYVNKLSKESYRIVKVS